MNDTRIIDLYWAREEAAIVESDKAYGPYCRTIAGRILSVREDAEECVSDTWLRAWNAMPPQRPTLLRQFFAAITRNLAFDRIKANTAAKRGGGTLTLALDELSQCVQGSPDVEDRLVMQDLGNSVNVFLAALPSQTRSFFLRRYFYLESVREIAERYGLTPNTVSVSLHRTRQRLREHLKEEGFLE